MFPKPATKSTVSLRCEERESMNREEKGNTVPVVVLPEEG